MNEKKTTEMIIKELLASAVEVFEEKDDVRINKK